MGYQHINNLYKSQEILAFKRCYSLEKIHGTSAHINWKQWRVDVDELAYRLTFFSGGEKQDKFEDLFDKNE
jgi:hypothetical protein